MTSRAEPSTLTRAAAATFTTNAAVVAFSLINVLILARALGPAGRGSVAFVIAVFVLTGGLASLGLEQANANLGGTRPERRATLATNSLLAALVVGAGAALLVGLLLAVVPAARGEADVRLLLLALAVLPSGLLGDYLKYLLQSDYRFGVTNAAWIASPAATALVNGSLAAAGRLSVALAVAVFAATNVLATSILAVSVARNFGFGRPDLGLARVAFSFGLKTHVTRFLVFGTYRADQWLLGAIAGPYELGLYSIALSITELLFYVSGVIVLVQRPHLVRALPAAAAEFAARIFRRALVLSGIAGAALFVLAPPLTVVLFGEEFRESGSYVRILAFAAFGVLAIDLFSNAATAQRRPLLPAAAAGAALLLMVTLNLVLAPELGALGAALAKTAAYTAGGATMVILFLRVFGSDHRALVLRQDDIAWYVRKARAGVAALRASRGG
ncbi:MAG: oligosaccharide flippase family protein [Actinomycetota bacterium]|nr:oligosaccharide flippase family protein [Actinomycetota bacterium]